MGIETILLFACSNFRLTKLVVSDEITRPIRNHFSTIVEMDDELYYKAESFIGRLITCFKCTSIWVAIFQIFLLLTMPTISYYLSLMLTFATIGSFIYQAYERGNRNG